MLPPNNNIMHIYPNKGTTNTLQVYLIYPIKDTTFTLDIWKR